jgi:hypothetical protein
VTNEIAIKESLTRSNGTARGCIMTDAKSVDIPDEVGTALARGRSGDAVGAIATMVELAARLNESEAAKLVSALSDTAAEFARFHAASLFECEAEEVRAVLANVPRPGLRYCDVAGRWGTAWRDRTDDIFTHVELSNCRRFVLVGAGELPITGLHVHDRTSVAHIDCLDTRPEAVRSVGALAALLGTDRLSATLCNGTHYDYANADVIFIANMVRPKKVVLSRVLDTAPNHARIIMRNPYSLGVLWAEDGCAPLDPRVRIVARGPGGSSLSRDVFLSRHAST